MKNSFWLKLALLPTCINFLTLPATAQNYGILKSFTATTTNAAGAYTNGDGQYPKAELILSGRTLYGVASQGGTGGAGTIFKINEDGSGFTNLHSFAAGALNGSSSFTNSDGQLPQSELALAGDTLYGVTEYGGKFGAGTLFRINTNGSAFTVLKQFPTSGPDGSYPRGGVVVVNSNTIYGTTSLNGSGNGGVLYSVATNGNNYVAVHNFDFSKTNSGEPFGTLLRSGSILYGTTYAGGAFSSGTVYSVNTNGNNFTVIKSFPALNNGTNGDGAFPMARLILSGNVLYGTTYYGGTMSNGVIFRVNTDGSGFTNLYSFTATTNSFGSQYNFDGANPSSQLVLVGKTLYGTAQFGGGSSSGTIVSIDTDGGNFLRLRTFGVVAPNDGRVPAAGFVLSGATFFGTTQYGGDQNGGTIFRYQWQPTPPVTITSAKSSVILSWPTNDFVFTLQSSLKLGAAAAWNNLTNATFIVNGANTLTNSLSGTEQFFRLSPY